MNRILALAIVATMCAAAPASAAKITCTKRAGDTVFRDRTLRVIQTVKRSKSDPDASTATLRVCKPGSRTAPKLLDRFVNTLDGSLTLQAVVRSGNHLALELDEQTGATDATDLFVYRLSARERTFSYASEAGFEYVVASGGGVALLEAGKVTGYDAAGERTLAATGASALAGRGDLVYWTAGGAAASATLTGEARRRF